MSISNLSNKSTDELRETKAKNEAEIRVGNTTEKY